MNFWKRLPRPFFALAPMEEVTDTVFRELIAYISDPGKLHLVFTEFMSVEGFLHEIAKQKVMHRLFISGEEKKLLKEKDIKIVAQIWGSDPEQFFKAGQQIAALSEFDGIDINMGCPVKKIVKNNACSALIKSPELAKEIIIAAKEGSGIPVSVKTRIGYNEVATESWIGNLLEVNPAAITIHGRTQKMKSEGEPDWNEVSKGAYLRNIMQSDTLIIGNGDIQSYQDGLEKAEVYGTDGIMVGRGIFRNPAFFVEPAETDHIQRIEFLKKHLTRFSEIWDGEKNYAILKRFFKIYIHSFEDAGSVRSRLMRTNSIEEGLEIINEVDK